MPANAKRIIWSAIYLVASAPAMSGESLPTMVRSCAAQTDESARLKCYDEAAAALQRQPDVLNCTNAGAQPPVVTSQPVTPAKLPSPRPEINPAEQFGLTSGQILGKESNGARPAGLKRLTARVVNISQRREGYLVLRLENGQVWEQTEGGPDLRIGEGAMVSIDRGLLGAYWLSRQSGRLAIKVRRTE
jgi:hypothetical protein